MHFMRINEGDRNRNGIHDAAMATYNDHRIAMSLAIAGLVTGDQQIEIPDCVAKTIF